MMKNIILYILIYVLLYTNAIVKLDSIDKKAVYYSIKHNNKFIFIPLKLSQKIKYFSNMLSLPFHNKEYLSYFSEGVFYSAIEMDKFPKLFETGDSKIFWYYFFKKNNIKTPKLYMYHEKNKIKRLHTTNPNKYYVIKPIRGGCGIGVKKVKGNEAIRECYNNDNILVQSFMQDYKYTKARHFRFISLYNGEAFLLYKLSQLDNNKISSNHTNGAQVELCQNYKCGELTFFENTELQKIIKKLCQIHQHNFSKVFSIGWDIMLTCNNKNINCYLLEGNFSPSCWFYPDLIPKEDIQNFKKKKYLFVENNNL